VTLGTSRERAAKIAALAGALAAVFIAGCASSHPGQGGAGPTATATASVTAPDLALCGSNTIGSQLGPDLAHGFLASLGAKEIRSTPGGDEQTLTASLHGRSMNVHIAAHGSATAFRGLAAGDCDVGMASRRIKGSEAADLRPLGNMLSPST
jgi:phosphate transport system substrate-binding protein